MGVPDSSDPISMSVAKKLGISKLVDAVEAGHEQVLLRNNKPVAAIISMERLEALQHLAEDLIDVAVGTSRLVTMGAMRHSLDDVLGH